MKQQRHIVRLMITLLVVFLSLPLLAGEEQGRGNYNFGYVSVGAGYTSLSHAMSAASSQGSYALLGGAGYEFRRQGFWLSVGAQFMMKQFDLTAGPYSTQEYPGIDDLGDEVNLVYIVNQTDRHDFYTIDIPLMLGYYYKGFYVGAGAKLGLALRSSIQTNGTYELRGRYEYYELHDFRYYTTYPYSGRQTCTLRPEWAVVGEIGYDLLSRLASREELCHILKIGFYCEYGLNSLKPKDAMDPLSFPDPKDATKAVINPYMLSSGTTGVNISNFVVGVKLTYLIGGSRSVTGTWHVGCQCYGN